MPIELKMPALSPTMEEGALSKWLVKEGDTVKSGDLLAEIETDKATMEYEATDEGVITKLVVPAGDTPVKVGAVIAIITPEDDEVAAPAPAAKAETVPEAKAGPVTTPAPEAKPAEAPKGGAANKDGDRVKASPLAKRLAQAQGVDLASVTGSGPNGRIVKADIDGEQAPVAKPMAEAPAPVAAPAPESAPTAKSAPAAAPAEPGTIPSTTIKLSSMRKVIARRLTESKQQVPHFYLTMDCNLDALLKLRGDLNAGLEARGVKLSVNDLLIKALAVALAEVPEANVQFDGDKMIMFDRVDISMAVAIPGGLITPIITDAANKSMSRIATEAKDLAARARDGKLQPPEYQGGTASISNLGMFGIKQFEAVINMPQGMILAVGSGDKRPYVVNGELGIATVLTATGSFDHRAIDGAVGAKLMQAFKRLIEKPLGMLA